MKHPESVSSSGAEHCERVQVERTPAGEVDWPDWAAVCGMTSASDAARQIRSYPLKDAAALLDTSGSSRAVAHSFGVFSWPSTVWATRNFLFVTAQRSTLAGCMRLPTNFALFQDGSALLLSERESEHVLEALGSAQADTRAISASGATHPARPCVVNLAFAREVFPNKSRELRVPLLVGALPPLGPDVWDKVAQAVAALQVFAGETGYRRGDCRGYRASMAAQDAARIALVGDIVLGRGAYTITTPLCSS